MQRRSAAVLAALVMALAPVGTGHAAPAKHVRPYDTKLLKYVNHARVLHGLKPLKESARLYAMAHRWAAGMAATGNLQDDPGAVYGQPELMKTCPHTTAGGANDGAQAQSDPHAMFESYKHEPFHWANILQPKYKDVGIATVRAKDGSEWDTMDFANHCD